MALGDERRESGRRMEQARRQNGARIESERRALDAAMVARRRGEAVVDDLQRLESPPRVQRSLPPVTARGGIPAARGRAYYADKPKMGGGGGVASPLDEKTTVDGAPDREYYPAGMRSSDGLFILPAIKTLNLTDANGDDVVIRLADPEGTL